MSEYISLKDAIATVKEAYENDEMFDGYEYRLNELPSKEIIQCKDCKHNPKESWFGCPMSHLSEEQRPETAWCWKGERRERVEEV